TRLQDIVRHRKLVLPQLGAPGVAAHEVKQRSGFKVEYGPVRATDLPDYLKTHRATPEMRQMRFTLRDRLPLIPVELVGVLLPMMIAAVILYFLGGFLTFLAVVAAILAGVVIFPILLPYLPTGDFSTKGFLLGGLVALPFALLTFFSHNPDTSFWRQVSGALTNMLVWPPLTAFIALNFTGSTTFTSRSGVRREIFRYIPIMAWIFGAGIVLAIVRILI
ncbi:MAG: mercury methylation corrinoid protein HgcA, partial [Dehalococcoidales bacterium]